MSLSAISRKYFLDAAPVMDMTETADGDQIA
jgi:hypothetical protein